MDSVNLLDSVITYINNLVSGPFMLIFLVFVGIIITFKTRFFQLTKFKLIYNNTIGALFKNKLSNADDSKGITSFQAMTTALAGTMGIGNIIGIGTAIYYGGPGAIFWMWVSAFFGCMTKYAEILLAIKFNSKDKAGNFIGGPMYYITKGLKLRWLGVIFAIFCTFASFGIGNMTQINAISSSLNYNFQINKSFSGIVITILIGLVIIGGIKRIGKITEKVIPFMSILYIIGALYVILSNFEMVPNAFKLIFSNAFSFDSVVSGAGGYIIMNAMKYGFSRGIFSNEAGLGSSPIAHAATASKNPVKQACWGVFEVTADTIIVSTLTALVILTSNVMYSANVHGEKFTELAFNSAMGSFGGKFISISIVFFAISSILSWAYYGEKSIEFISNKSKYIYIYRALFLVCIFIGAMAKVDIVWQISEILNCLMAVPNLIAIIGLRSIVIKLTKEHTSIKT